MNQVYQDPNVIAAVAKRLQRGMTEEQLADVYGAEAVTAAVKFIAENPPPEPVGGGPAPVAGSAPAALGVSPEQLAAVHERCEALEAGNTALQTDLEVLKQAQALADERLAELESRVTMLDDPTAKGGKRGPGRPPKTSKDTSSAA